MSCRFWLTVIMLLFSQLLWAPVPIMDINGVAIPASDRPILISSYE